ncbi:anti-sigma factor [Paraburkholderia sp. J8-2]|uniref:anti-sigma factor family protein n=1 Tax=Paraburkholderia sp. J8-2 TaxID=2805440 RepID=UPI002AB6E8CC|nr:anti-sigma factor [Paraburkholderia sp. J8-2]
MDHGKAFELLPGYIDSELTLGETVEFEHHLSGCAVCHCVLASQRRVSTLLKTSKLQFTAPAELRARIKKELHPRESLFQRLVDWLPSWKEGGRSGRAATGVMIISAAAFMGSGMLYLAAPSSDVRLSQEFVDNHVRSLQLNHLIDVISTDRHTVKPWFEGKIDFAPPVLNLAQDGYPLVGGRLDYLDGRTVAVMVYRYKLHAINLYVWPGHDAGDSAKVHEQQGYHIAHWTDGRMNYWAITDAGKNELYGFVKSLRAQAGS